MRQSIHGKEEELGFEITPRESTRIPPIIFLNAKKTELLHPTPQIQMNWKHLEVKKMNNVKNLKYLSS